MPGHSIGAALVGTFLGVLLSYGFVGPIGTNLAHVVEDVRSLLTRNKNCTRKFYGRLSSTGSSENQM